MANCGQGCCKGLSIIFEFLLLLSGIGIIAIAAVILVNQNFNVSGFTAVVIVIAAFGGFVLFLNVCGIICTRRLSRSCICLYVIFLILLTIGDATLGILFTFVPNFVRGTLLGCEVCPLSPTSTCSTCDCTGKSSGNVTCPGDSTASGHSGELTNLLTLIESNTFVAGIILIVVVGIQLLAVFSNLCLRRTITGKEKEEKNYWENVKREEAKARTDKAKETRKDDFEKRMRDKASRL